MDISHIDLSFYIERMVTNMYHYSYNDLPSLTSEIMYNDQYTGQAIMGVVVKVEHIGPATALVYIMSPYDDENDKVELDGLRYKDILVFDDRPDEEHGWNKVGVKGMIKSL